MGIGIDLGDILTFAGVVITCIISNSKTQWRLEQLEKKQDKHNNVIERVLIIEENEKAQWRRIDEIREVVNGIKREVYGHE